MSYLGTGGCIVRLGASLCSCYPGRRVAVLACCSQSLQHFPVCLLQHRVCHRFSPSRRCQNIPTSAPSWLLRKQARGAQGHAPTFRHNNLHFICLLAEALHFLDHCSLQMGLKPPLGAVAWIDSLIWSMKSPLLLCSSWDCNCSPEMGFMFCTCLCKEWEQELEPIYPGLFCGWG